MPLIFQKRMKQHTTHSRPFSHPLTLVYWVSVLPYGEVATIHASTIVNNVGRSHDIPVYFDEAPAAEIDDILEVNIHATLKVTKMVLPTLLRR